MVFKMIFSVIYAPILIEMASGSRKSCNSDQLAVYKVQLQTYWTREKFPKQYPEFRPPAQWSKIIGRTHNDNYTLFRLNEKSSDAFRQFAELAKSELLESESQGAHGVLDQFTGPSIPEGTGESRVNVFVDGRHSMVSLASRLIPSPDWFVGVDSVDLCRDGRWTEAVKMELHPMDAGTDNGFTFTSPNWATVPRKPIARISAQRPDHPANSFYYPDRAHHPPLAVLRIAKVKEYKLSQEFTQNLLEKSLEFSKEDASLQRDDRPLTGNDVLPSQADADSQMRLTGSATSEVHRSRESFRLSKKYKRKLRKSQKRKKSRSRRYHRTRDCIVSEWENWSPCSKKCGIGEQARERKILKHSKKGGRPCPTLKEKKWCGSSRGCGQTYFDW